MKESDSDTVPAADQNAKVAVPKPRTIRISLESVMSTAASTDVVAMNGKTRTAPTTSYAATIALQTLIFQTAMSQKRKSTFCSIVI